MANTIRLTLPPTETTERRFMGPTRQSEYWGETYGRHAQENAPELCYDACESESESEDDGRCFEQHVRKPTAASPNVAERKADQHAYGVVVRNQNGKKLMIPLETRGVFDYDPEDEPPVGHEDDSGDLDLEPTYKIAPSRNGKHSISTNDSDSHFAQAKAIKATPRKPGILTRRKVQDMGGRPSNAVDQEGFVTLSQSSDSERDSPIVGLRGAQVVDIPELDSDSSGRHDSGDEILITAAKVATGPNGPETRNKPFVGEALRPSRRIRAARESRANAIASFYIPSKASRTNTNKYKPNPTSARALFSTVLKRLFRRSPRSVTAVSRTPGKATGARRSARHQAKNPGVGMNTGNSRMINWKGEALTLTNGMAYVLERPDELTEAEKAEYVFVPDNTQ